MSRELFTAVMSSDIKRVRSALANLRYVPGLNNEIFPRTTILDIAIQQANNSETSSSRKIARILRDRGAVRFSELSHAEIPLNDEPIALTPRSLPATSSRPPLAPFFVGTPRKISRGIVSIKGGKTRARKTRSKRNKKEL